MDVLAAAAKNKTTNRSKNKTKKSKQTGNETNRLAHVLCVSHFALLDGDDRPGTRERGEASKPSEKSSACGGG